MTHALTVIIVNRDEPMLGFTIRRVMETADCPVEVIVVDDGSVMPPTPELTRDLLRRGGDSVRVILNPKPIGLAYSRDVGIERAANEACLILDAHTNFPDASGWATYCVDHALAYPHHFACAVSVQLDSDPWNTPERQMDMVGRWDGSGERHGRAKYYGARILIIDAKTGRPFPSKWNGDYADLIVDGEWGIIQSALGGHYLLNRSWYMDVLHRPWRENRAWGSSEQTITIANWLCGGESVLLPLHMGHQYRTGKQARVPYPFDEHMQVGQIWNQWRLVNMLPLPGDMRERLTQVVAEVNPRPAVLWALNYDRGQVGVYRDYLATQDRTMAEYFERWGMDTTIPTVEQIRAGWQPGTAEGQ